MVTGVVISHDAWRERWVGLLEGINAGLADGMRSVFAEIDAPATPDDDDQLTRGINYIHMRDARLVPARPVVDVAEAVTSRMSHFLTSQGRPPSGGFQIVDGPGHTALRADPGPSTTTRSISS